MAGDVQDLLGRSPAAATHPSPPHPALPVALSENDISNAENDI